MQRFELSLNDTNKLLTREPLLIVRLSILKPGLPNTMRPVRKKHYQDHTFALLIPLELDNDSLDFLNLKHLSWSCLLERAWWRHLQILPHTPIWESLVSSVFISPLHYLDFFLCTLTWSTLQFFFFLHNDDVLRMHTRAHSILFLKTQSI
jgi:hypothetical protein